MSASKVYVELNETVDRMEVSFQYNRDDVAKLKGEYDDRPGIARRRWDQERKLWILPLDLKVARQLRDLYLDRLELGPAMRAWARQQVNLERNLTSLHDANDAKLKNVPRVIEDIIAGKAMKFKDLPAGHALLRKRDARPFQRADIKLMSLASAMNLNDVGVGKTIETIGAIYEAGLVPQPVLVVAPRRSLVTVWRTEFERLTDYQVFTSEDPGERSRMIEEFLTMVHKNRVEPYALAIIADDLRLDKYRDVKKDGHIVDEDELHVCRDYQGNWYRFRSRIQRDLFLVQYGAFVVDEFHSTGLPNRRTLFHTAAKEIKAHRRWLLSATPIGGKPRRLWPCLNFIDPKGYTSEWRWIEEFLELEEEEVFVRGGRGARRTVKNVGGIKDEHKFHEAHKKHMVRRNRLEALPGLPVSLDLMVSTPMTEKQEAQYREFEKNHEIIIDQKRLSGSIVLAQYVRMRQMANAALKQDGNGKWVATPNSGKLDVLLDRLAENGIRKANRQLDVDAEPGARAYVGVEDKSFVTVIVDFLHKNGIPCDRLDGDTPDSEPLLTRFNDTQKYPEPYVIVMTSKTGGSSINLPAAGSAHLLEESWDPDVTHQLFGRGDRGGRTTSLKCYTYRTPNSIQQYVAQVAAGKKITNSNILNYVKEIEALRKAQK